MNIKHPVGIAGNITVEHDLLAWNTAYHNHLPFPATQLRIKHTAVATAGHPNRISRTNHRMPKGGLQIPGGLSRTITGSPSVNRNKITLSKHALAKHKQQGHQPQKVSLHTLLFYGR